MNLEKLASILSEFQKPNAAAITEATEFRALELDSLDMLEVLMRVEEETGVTIPADGNFGTVGEVLAFINAEI